MSLDLVGNNTASILRNPQNISQAESAFSALRITQKPHDNSGMTVGNEIRRRRKALKLTLEQMVERLERLGDKTDTGNLSRIETGKQQADEAKLRSIATALGCTAAELFAGAEGAGNVVPVALGSRRIPLISHVQAGCMTEIVDPYSVGDAADWLITDLDLSSAAFALEIKGESMLPEFSPGDRVIIDPSIIPDPGNYVVAKNGDNEATFKKYRPRGINERGDHVFELVPLNDDYPSLRSDVSHVQIIGTMVEHRRYRKK